ncbi:hypothetical protein GGS24DRAFT_474432 [Hypoxylon argillaceum]|nr:hypothetical protein GGS24DRAFT_474432 [Hypoxylon argillaceum]
MSARSPWISQIIRLEYHDSYILAQELGKIYGPNNFSVKVQGGAYRLTLPRRLSHEQIRYINDTIRNHYHPQDE